MQYVVAPYKSVAWALVFVVLLGPVGLFYSSFLGGLVMLVLGVGAVGVMHSTNSMAPMFVVWALSLLWAMISIRLYNRSIFNKVLHGDDMGVNERD
jgi:hypothetical protein